MTANDYIVLSIMFALASIGLVRELRKPYREKQPSISDYLIKDIDSTRYAITRFSADLKPKVFSWTFNVITRVSGIEALTESPKTFANAYITSIKHGATELLKENLPLSLAVINHHDLPIPPLTSGSRVSVSIVYQGKLTVQPTGTHLIPPRRKRRKAV